ncbi:MAG: hypothetical protein KBD24_02865, partial [Candidatus Pacebacteria bacterium]|nr:hypothetical protein [Candidatus Paceibacterota bacterium]
MLRQVFQKTIVTVPDTLNLSIPISPISHRTLNEKALRFGFFPSDLLEAIQYKLNLFLGYYNFRKKHRGLGMDGLTPVQKLRECASVNLTLQCY